MLCKKCKKDIPDGSLYCNFCGKKQITAPRKRSHKRAHGSGTITKDSRYVTPYVAHAALDASGKRKYLGAFPTYQAAQDAIDDYNRRGCPDAYNATLEDVYNLWSATHYKQIAENSAYTLKCTWKRFAPLYKKKIAELKTPDFQAIIDTSTGKSTANTLKTLAQLICRYALENDIIQKNYAEFVKIPKYEKKEKVIFTREQIAQLWEHSADKRVQVILAMIYMGFRIGEIHALTHENIHLVDGFVIAGEKTEAGRNRIIPFPPSIPEIIGFFAGWMADTPQERLFDMPSHAFRSKYFYDPLIEYGLLVGRCISGNVYEFADENHLTPHSTRHTFASLSADAGIRPENLQKIIGHANFETTANIYIHKDYDQLRAEMSKLKR